MLWLFIGKKRSAEQKSDSGTDDDAPLSTYRQPGSGTKAPQPSGPTETEYLEKYLTNRNNQLKVDSKTEHSTTRGGDHRESMASASKPDNKKTDTLLQQLNAEKKKREVLSAEKIKADTKYKALQKKLETEREGMELTTDEHRKMEAAWKEKLEMSEAEKTALKAALEAEKKTRQMLEEQQNDQVSKYFEPQAACHVTMSNSQIRSISISKFYFAVWEI